MRSPDIAGTLIDLVTIGSRHTPLRSPTRMMNEALHGPITM